MSTRRLAIVGLGRMGSAVRALASDAGWTIAAQIGRLTTADQLADADLAIEFTRPDAAVNNIMTCLDARCPVVVGTTGWYDELPRVRDAVVARGGAMLWAANFSLGANVVALLAAKARLALPLGQFPSGLVETHHAAKRDAPSGTAREIARGLEDGAPITSLRVGQVPGTHEVVFDGAYEQIRVEHVVRDRRVFAEGALTAAGWLVGRRGVFTMRDMLEVGS